MQTIEVSTNEHDGDPTHQFRLSRHLQVAQHARPRLLLTVRVPPYDWVHFGDIDLNGVANFNFAMGALFHP